jgi:hypothetical protein
MNPYDAYHGNYYPFMLPPPPFGFGYPYPPSYYPTCPYFPPSNQPQDQSLGRSIPESPKAPKRVNIHEEAAPEEESPIREARTKRKYRKRRHWLEKKFRCNVKNCRKKYTSKIALNHHKR